MQSYFQQKNVDYRFYNNLDILPEWFSVIMSKSFVGNERPLEWIARMLRVDPVDRPTATALFELISSSPQEAEKQLFSGACCDVDVSSEDSGSDGEIWAEDPEAVVDRHPTLQAPKQPEKELQRVLDLEKSTGSFYPEGGIPSLNKNGLNFPALSSDPQLMELTTLSRAHIRLVELELMAVDSQWEPITSKEATNVYV
jgi:hypothetical protein